ncbi:MAG: hypothetical protein C5B55_00470 [Blastocatellia bacterium]|nr:MAG: hypothetical protein C5B55_00470 [Blastocatellia bacterium]
MSHNWVATVFVSLVLAVSVCSQTTTPKPAPPDKNKFALIISGPGGEPDYSKQFDQWTTQLQQILTSRYSFPAEQLAILNETGSKGAKKSTAEEVRNAFSSLQTKLQPDNVLYVFFIGHGSSDGRESKFNLVGRDMSATDYASLFAALPTKRIVIFNMSSASGEFIKSLSTKGRVVVTATRSGQEQNATRFPGFFISALSASDADADQDGHISVLEAFAYATRLTAEFYSRAGRLATEHALLEDNGDGVGHEKMEEGDGLLARATYLDSLNVEQAAANVATAKLLREKERLESDINELIGNKRNLSEAEYESRLEKLFIELAKINRTIKQAGS